MADHEHITPEQLRQLLRYDPATGKLFWLPRPGHKRSATVFNAQFAGKEAFTCRMGQKHLQGRILGKGYLAHRVIWALVHGEWPKGEVDHINGNPVDNRIVNLRDIPKADNQRNMKRSAANLSGVTGVGWQPTRRMWRVRVANRHIGRFKDFGEAVRARNEAYAKAGFHPNHGRG